MYWRLKLNFEIPIDVLQAYSLVLENDVVCHKSNVKQLYQTQKIVKRMLYKLDLNVLLHYVLIYNQGVSFNFHLTFLRLNVIKMFTVQ